MTAVALFAGLSLLWMAAGAIILAAVVDVSHIDPRAGRREVGWCLDRHLATHPSRGVGPVRGRSDPVPAMPSWLVDELAPEHILRWLTGLFSTSDNPDQHIRWNRPTLVLAGRAVQLAMFDAPPYPIALADTAQLEAIPA